MSFNQFGLNPILLRALEACGFTSPTEIQRQAIPVALDGKDILASAQTGTGKTAAFVLPTVERLLTPSQGKGHGPRALILTPTRELAMQVAQVVQQLGSTARMRSGIVVGGMPYPPQQRLLRAPLDVLVATPGRLIDHMERNAVDFSRLEVLILDEADRMLDMGFVKAVTRIAQATPANRQTLLFSATLEDSVLDIARRHMKTPVRIQLAVAKQRHESIDQWLHQANDTRHKKAVLSHLLSRPEMTQAVVFTATKRGAQSLATELSDLGHSCAALHGNMTQGARRRTVDQLRSGRVRVLVATDVAARGLDVPGISHVINFELPMTPEDYIHRIGRTGRAGASGTAISLVGRQDWRKLADIERLTGRAIERRNAPAVTMPQPPQGAPAPGRPMATDTALFNGKKRPFNKQGNPTHGKPGPRADRDGVSTERRHETRGDVRHKTQDAHKGGFVPRSGQSRHQGNRSGRFGAPA